METKFIKVKCEKTNKFFALEVVKKNGHFEIVNFVDLTAEDAKHICTEISTSELITANNLIPCKFCGTRKFASCSCNKSRKNCSSSDKYDYQCVYCDELQIDFSRIGSHSPYTKWAGVSNIPAAAKDRFGNPQGGQYDLAQDGSFKGYTIIVLNLCSECDFKLPAEVLRIKGFTIQEFKSMPSNRELSTRLSLPNSQLWIIADRNGHMNNDCVGLIYDYFVNGHGVYVWGDNQPYYVDANLLLHKMFGAEVGMTGDTIGDQVISIQQGANQPGIIPNHPITTGIVNFYEGITIATVSVGKSLKPLVYGSAKNIVTAYYDNNGRRALVDGGFTRLYHKWDSAGTDRYVVNAAAWLANIERFGYNPQ